MLIQNVDIRIDKNIREDENYTVEISKKDMHIRFQFEDISSSMRLLYAIEDMKRREDQEAEAIWSAQEREYMEDKRLI